MPTTRFKPDYCSERLLKYVVKITGYDANFKLLVIRHATKTNNYASAWKFYIKEESVWCWKKELWILLNLKSGSWGQLGKFQSTDENILEFMIE